MAIDWNAIPDFRMAACGTVGTGGGSPVGGIVGGDVGVGLA